MSTVEEETEGSSGRESGNDSFERDILRNGRRYTNVFKLIYLKVTFYLRTLSPCLSFLALHQYDREFDSDESGGEILNDLEGFAEDEEEINRQQSMYT